MKKFIPNIISLFNIVIALLFIFLDNFDGLPEFFKVHLYFIAGVFLLITSILDGIDGVIARKLNAVSETGGYLDSLSDYTSFGIATMYITYKLYLFQLNITIADFSFPIGMLICIFYIACTGYRLARYHGKTHAIYFSGLPSTASSIFICILIVLHKYIDMNALIVGCIIIIFSLLMISKLKYIKLSYIFTKKWTWKWTLIFCIALIAFEIAFKWYILAIIMSAWYNLLGVQKLAITKWQNRKK